MQHVMRSLGLVVLAIVAAACSGASAAPPSAGPSSSPTGDAIVVVARDMAFDTASISVAAETPTTIVLDNQDAAPHNVAVKAADGTTVFKGEIVTKSKTTGVLPALAAGSYTFWCEVHPEMQGTLEVK